MTNRRPSTDSRDNSVVAGVRRALELLCQLSPKQAEVTGEKIKVATLVIKEAALEIKGAAKGDQRAVKEIEEAVFSKIQ